MSIKRRHLLGMGISTAAVAACGKIANAPSTTPSVAPVAATSKSASKLRLGFQPPYVAVFALRQEKFLEKAFVGQSTSF
ncbi:MAG: hypothetical protein V7L11_15105 [Nostoc sp.]|uniref:hypothetical protein n=1 Tax=Nostoc sp. TaxID=1180 RepID=UPI002FF63C21